ncbi:MAG TPA: hypothetical protein VLD39_14655 [Gammaproteobacteria bacterium]|nr:hypothetical protein [Gammaproteobacteria bacterium]
MNGYLDSLDRRLLPLLLACLIVFNAGCTALAAGAAGGAVGAAVVNEIDEDEDDED